MIDSAAITKCLKQYFHLQNLATSNAAATEITITCLTATVFMLQCVGGRGLGWEQDWYILLTIWHTSHAGMSSVKMAISQIGVSCPDDTFGKESRVGVPFTVSQFTSLFSPSWLWDTSVALLEQLHSGLALL